MAIQLFAEFTKEFEETVNLTDTFTPKLNKFVRSVRTKITVNDVGFENYRNLKVTRTIGDFNTSSNFQVVFDSPFGRHKSDFDVGQEIKIFADKDVAILNTLLLTGIIERVKFRGTGNTQTVTLSGRDFSARLQDVTVEPVIFSNQEVSTIVASVINSEVSDITTNNVNVTTTTLERIAFNHLTVFDALSELAELSGFVFFVDNDKDLHFERKNITSTGLTLNNTNITDMIFNKTREKMANIVWVYGDRTLAGFEEEFVTGSPSADGSVFTLKNRPHNTLVKTVGNVPQKGGVFNMTAFVESGTNYLVNFFDQQIIFTSGPDIGDSIPTSGGSIIVTYDRDVPIAKFAQNNASIQAFGPKEKVIQDKSIKDPKTAESILNTEIAKADPFRGMELTFKGWENINAGDTVNVVLDDFNLSETNIGIVAITYLFDRNTIESEKIIRFRLDTKIIDITDQIKSIQKRLTLIEAQDLQSTDTLTRLEQSTGSMRVVGSFWKIETNIATGSVSLLYSTVFTPSINPFNLASGIDQGVLAGPPLGSAFTAFSIIRSGGFF